MNNDSDVGVQRNDVRGKAMNPLRHRHGYEPLPRHVGAKK
jgi:ribosomal protein L2